MQTKLTLRLDDELINRAKSHAKKNGKSVSQIVARYFSLLDADPAREASEFTPLVQSLKGSLKGASVGKEDYHEYLVEKYL
jgi:negative regulator of replication initiation